MITHVAIFSEKSTGKQLYKLSSRPLNKFFWEKEKLQVIDKLVRDRFIDKHDIDVKELAR